MIRTCSRTRAARRSPTSQSPQTATNRRKPADREQEERTDWHRPTLWNRQAQFAEDYVRVGDRIYIEGRLEYEAYERDGVTIPTAEIIVHTVVMLSTKAGVSDEELEEAA